jgi:hypothetical protein
MYKVHKPITTQHYKLCLSAAVCICLNKNSTGVMWVSHRGGHEGFCSLGRDAVLCDKSAPIFDRNLLPASQR